MQHCRTGCHVTATSSPTVHSSSFECGTPSGDALVSPGARFSEKLGGRSGSCVSARDPAKASSKSAKTLLHSS
eukprot:scaffold7356_cov249-Pinguiococcus_pyrenoidosus.AAC.9